MPPWTCFGESASAHHARSASSASLLGSKAAASIQAAPVGEAMATASSRPVPCSAVPSTNRPAAAPVACCWSHGRTPAASSSSPLSSTRSCPGGCSSSLPGATAHSRSRRARNSSSSSSASTVGAIPRLALGLVRGDLERDVVDERREATVEQHGRQVVAQRLPHLAADLVDPVGQRGHRAELLDPLGRGLLAHAGDPRQVVGRVAAQRCEIGVLRRGHAVLLEHGVGSHAGQVGDPLAGVEHGDARLHELQRVAVAGEDEDVEALGAGPAGQRRDDVVGLEAWCGDDRDPQAPTGTAG